MHALLFDLDGTLVDSVYAHVLAWQRALAEAGLTIEGHRLHRHVGSSGGLILSYSQRETGRQLTAEESAQVRHRHEEIFRELAPRPPALPGAAEILRTLQSRGVPHAIATASYRPIIDTSLEALGVNASTVVVEGRGTLHGKPEPDLFLAARDRLGMSAGDCIVVGDSVWDHIGARRAGMLSVGVMTGGYGEEELFHAGAFRVFRDTAELLRALEELGIEV